MTGPSTSGHLDLDALADALAGERTGERHLRDCAACAERLAELAGAEVAVVAALATLPAPALPDGLSERLAAALKAEASPPSSGSATGSGPGLRSVPTSARVRDARPARRRRTPSWLPAAAAGVALVLAGGLGLDALTGAGGQDASTDTAAGGGSGAEQGSDSASADDSATADESAALTALVSSGVDYADERQREAALPRLLAAADAAKAFMSASRPPEPAAPRASAAQPPQPVEPQSPAQQRSSSPTDVLGDAAATDPAVGRLREPAAFAECLAGLRREGAPAAEPLALDAALFEGEPAVAVVQPDTDPARLVLTVVGPGCSVDDTDTLLSTRLPRP